MHLILGKEIKPASCATTPAEHLNLGSATSAASGYARNARLRSGSLTSGLTLGIQEARTRQHAQPIGSVASVAIRELPPTTGGGTNVGMRDPTGVGTKGATVNKHSDNLKARFCCDSRNAVAGLMLIWGR